MPFRDQDLQYMKPYLHTNGISWTLDEIFCAEKLLKQQLSTFHQGVDSSNESSKS